MAGMDVPAMGTLLGIRRQQVASRLDVPDGRQVARAPVRLQDRHNGEMAPPLSTGVVWTGASAPINSDAVRCTGRLALARLAGGRAQEGPEVCATTTYLHQGVRRRCSSGEGDGCAGCRQVQTG